MGHLVINFFFIGVSAAIGSSWMLCSKADGSGSGGGMGSEDVAVTGWDSTEAGAGLDATKGVTGLGSSEPEEFWTSLG